MNKTRRILFCDFDGVLCHDRYWRSLPVEEQMKVQRFLFGEDTALVGDWMRGKHSAEEVTQILSKQTSIPYEKLWSTLIKDCKSMNVSRDILKKLNGLREFCIVILVTSNMDSFTRFTQPALGLESYFDRVTNSFNEGMLKTDNGGELYLKLAAKYETSIKDCIVFDDSKNVQNIFTELGGIAYLVTKEQDLAFHLERIDQY